MKDREKILIKLVIFTVENGKLMLLTKNSRLPYEEYTGSKTFEKTVEDIFSTSVGHSLDNCYIEQLYTFNTQKNNEIAIVYYALIPDFIRGVSDGKLWVESEQNEKPGKDEEIIKYSIMRLRWKMEYTNVIYSLLPDKFTLSELQLVYEAILGKVLDKRNFRKKILSLDILKKSGKKKKGVVARPADMYEFKNKSPVIVKVF